MFGLSLTITAPIGQFLAGELTMPLEKEYFNEIDDEKQEVLREEYGDVMEWEFLSEIEPEECGCWKDQICDECKSKWYNGFVENDYQLPY